MGWVNCDSQRLLAIYKKFKLVLQKRIILHSLFIEETTGVGSDSGLNMGPFNRIFIDY